MRTALPAMLLLGLAHPALAQPAPAPQPAPADPFQAPPPPPATNPTGSADATPPPGEPPVVVQPAVPVEHVEPPKEEPKKDKPKTLPVQSKWDVSFYGFVEFDGTWDSTQGLNEIEGNTAIAKPGSYAGNHPQLAWSGRNSRFGFKVAAPTYHDIKATAQLELDFLGNQPSTAPLVSVSEGSFYGSPTVRFRHMFMNLETPYVNVLAGQTWQLFGWQTYFQPATVQVQGAPGEVFTRAEQVRITKVIKTDAVNVEAALSAGRPVSRTGFLPDGTLGVKLSINKWVGYHSVGSATSAVGPAAIGVSVIGRRFAVNELSATPAKQETTNGYGVSVDALIPIVSPKDKDHRENSLTLTGNFQMGAGIADMFQSLSGGTGNAAPANPTGATPAPVYTPNIDGGLALYAATDKQLHAVQWTAYMAGLQYYLPGNIVWLSANYSHLSSDNARDFGAAAKVWDKQDWIDGNVFFDITPAVRIGAEYSHTQQTYVDGIDATDHRVQVSGFFIF